MTADNVDKVRFDALRNAIYHSARKGFFDTLNRVLSFIVVAAGTAAVGDLGARHGLGSVQLFAAIAAMAGTLQLVFDFGVKARTHEFLQRRFYELIADISRTTTQTDADVGRWRSALESLYSEEPTPMRALDAIAYNAACESLGVPKNKQIAVRWHHSLLRQLYPFHQTTFEYEP